MDVREPINKDAAKILSRKTVPATTVEQALKIIASNIGGEITRDTVRRTLDEGLEAEYTLRVKKCPKKPGHNVTMTFKKRSAGFSAAHFTDLA